MIPRLITPDDPEFHMDLAKHAAIGRVCRSCGCTYNDPCFTEDGTCHWVEPDLCSACAEEER